MTLYFGMEYRHPSALKGFKPSAAQSMILYWMAGDQYLVNTKLKTHPRTNGEGYLLSGSEAGHDPAGDKFPAVSLALERQSGYVGGGWGEKE